MPAPGQTPSYNANVAELQRVLKTYAQATGYTAADPGPVDGIVGTKTIMAVVSIAPQVPKLPSQVKALLPVVTILLATTDGQAQAKSLITSYASDITKAILAVAVISAASGTPNNSGGNGLPNVQIVPVGPTANNIPAGAKIYFFDTKRGAYRIAVMRGLLGLGAASYVEVSPSTMAPAGGILVSKNTFLVQTGQWYATPIGIAGLVAGGSALLGGATFLIARLFR